MYQFDLNSLMENEQSVVSVTSINTVIQYILCWDNLMTFKWGWTNLTIKLYNLSHADMFLWLLKKDEQTDELGRACIVYFFSLSIRLLKNEQSVASLTLLFKVMQSVSGWYVFMIFEEGWTNLMSWEGHM